MKELFLIIDTTIYGASIGLSSRQGDHCEYQDMSNEVSDSARLLPIMIDRGLANLNCSIEEISHVCISPGPGSFTGIRVGLSYAFGLVSGLQAKGQGPKTLGVSSLDALSRFRSRERSEDLALFLPATRSTGYVSIVKDNIVTLRSIDLDAIDVFKNLPKSWSLLGDWPQLRDVAVQKGMSLENSFSLAEAAKMAVDEMRNVALDSLSWDEAGGIPSPIYLRRSSVEEKAARDLIV